LGVVESGMSHQVFPQTQQTRTFDVGYFIPTIIYNNCLQVLIVAFTNTF